MSLFLIILAAGEGKRLNSAKPKQFNIVGNKTLLEHSISAFKDIKGIKKTVIVYNKKHKKFLNKLKFKKIEKIIGGSTRQKSTFNALKKISKMNCKNILIHDAARPSPPKHLIKKIINKLKNSKAVIPLIKTNDAVKRYEKNSIFKNIERSSLGLAQTPQGFNYKEIFKKHIKYQNYSFDDDSALFTKDNEKVNFVEGSKINFKITSKEDLNFYKNLKNKKNNYGIGFDIHKLVRGRKLYLGGIKIPFHLGLEGHSDADPVLHAIIDSLLGACGLGDIGKLFSNRNKKYKNIRSTILLEEVVKLIKLENYLINNIDINIIAQNPKIKKFSKKIILKISKICKINTNKINIKGKTTEKLGLIGRGNAIASEVISSVTKYD